MRILPTLLAVSLLGASCGGGSSPAAPTPLARTVTFVAFLDENRNGQLDGPETIRIPGAEISFGGASGKTAGPTGEVSLNVLPTAQTLSVNPASLPSHHRPPEAAVMTPPASGPW